MKKYVTTWGNAVSIADRRPENYAKNLTLRYPIRPMFDGDRLKLTFDNFCGTEPVTISRIYVADSADSGRGIVEETNTQVTFDNGCGSVTIPAGRLLSAMRSASRSGAEMTSVSVCTLRNLP